MTLNFTNITSPEKLITYVNNEVNGMIGVGILLSMLLIIFIFFKARGWDTPVCAVASSFNTMIVSILLFSLGWINEMVLIAFISTFIASFLWVSLGRR
jgi:hypothetical protein